MVIVPGRLTVAPGQAESSVEAASKSLRKLGTQSAVSTSLSLPTFIEHDQINIFEQWESREAVEAFRGGGPDDEQSATMLATSSPNMTSLTHAR